MGRVASYKKVKASYKNHHGGEYVWGTSATNKSKKRSVTSQQHQKKKLKSRENRDTIVDDGGFDLPPDKDDFDLEDFVVKKQTKKRLDHDLLLPKSNSTMTTVRTSSSSDGLSNDANGTADAETTADASGAKPTAIVKSDDIRIGNTNVACHIPADDREEIRAAKMLRMDPKTGKSTSKQATKKSSIEGRREGESMNAFHRRLKEDTANALAENYKKNLSSNDPAPVGDGGEEKLTKAQRKKEYSKMRKKKRKGKSSTRNSDQYDTLSDDEEAAAAVRVSFLDRAEQPPTFSAKQIPRGAHKKLKMKMKDDGKNDGSSSKATMDEGKIKAEQNAMEIMRRKVQAQYALMKARRRQEHQGANNFHTM